MTGPEDSHGAAHAGPVGLGLAGTLNRAGQPATLEGPA